MSAPRRDECDREGGSSAGQRWSYSQTELEEVFRLKFGDPKLVGWRPRNSFRVHYFTPDDHYEALVARLVKPGAAWLDVGGGRHLFPQNPALAQLLRERSGDVVAVDPDATLAENAFAHTRIQAPIEEYQSERTFCLVTLRMVAEHLAEPERVIQSLARLTSGGSIVVVYTVNRWSPAAVVAWLTPFRFHHTIKRLLWRSEERDTFPVEYKLNTRQSLARQFAAGGFRERHFRYLDDCRIFARFRALYWCELSLWRVLKTLGLPYPENCLLGVYERL